MVSDERSSYQPTTSDATSKAPVLERRNEVLGQGQGQGYAPKPSAITASPTPTQMIDAVVDATMTDAVDNATIQRQPDEPAVSVNALEKENIANNVENTPELSQGVDPNVAFPRTSDDVAILPGPVINGQGDPNHHAAVVHLPPSEEQEAGPTEQDEKELKKTKEEQQRYHAENKKLRLEVSADGHAHDAASSPGSTEAPMSATTANHHETSADTSPDNEANHYGGDSMDVDKPADSAPASQPNNDERARTPELQPTDAEKREKEQHDSRLKAQMELVREKILENSPVGPDSQLLDEQAKATSAAATPRPELDRAPSQTLGTRPDVRELKTGIETADMMMDEEADNDEVVGVPIPVEEKVSGNASRSATPKPVDVADAVPGLPTIEEGEPKVVGPPQNSQDVGGLEKPQEARAEGEKVGDASNGHRTPVSIQEEPAKATSPEQGEPGAAPTVSATSSGPSRAPTVPAATPAPIERMTTRVASGALKHKSVSEILGETPRSDKSRVGTASPGSPAAKLRLAEKVKEKERSKLSTVVFSKKPQTPQKDAKALGAPALGDNTLRQDTRDYFMPLFQSAAYANQKFPPLDQLINSAHKTITTSNSAIPYQENQAQRIVRRIYALENADKWSLRQPKRAMEPNRPAAHWDELLKEVKWMRTDVRQERKWKMAFARKAAYECAMWVQGDAEQRALLERKVVKLKSKEEHDAEMKGAEETEGEQSVETNEAEVPQATPHPTPDLVPSSDNDTAMDEFDDEPSVSHLDAVAPTAIFRLDNDDLVFALNNTPISNKLLEELPIYGTPLQIHHHELANPTFDPDAHWKKSYLPISKFTEGKIVLKDETPPAKKSKFDYEPESDDDDEIVFGQQTDRKAKELKPEQIEVALFNPDNKHLRERIHAGHQFRPPSEFPMPLQSFFENRLPSQWTWAEDDELKTLVREYQYNWSLIASILGNKGIYTAAPERRTPWECFERWINLEGLPSDMVKTNYFRAYNNRIENARRNLVHQAQIQAAQPAPAPGGSAAPIRQPRRSTDSVRVEIRKNTKHFSLLDAMRKVYKKREVAVSKQQHAQQQANMRKQPEAPANMMKHTPQQISKLKHDREVQLAERMARNQLMQDQARRVNYYYGFDKTKEMITDTDKQMAQAQAHGRTPQNPGGFPIGANGLPQIPRGMAGVQTPGMANRPQNLTVPVPNHLPHVPMQSLQPGMQPGMGKPMVHPGMGQMPISGIPQAQMGMGGIQHAGNRMAVPNANTPDHNLVMQAQRISAQQRAAVMQQHGQGQTGQGMQGSPQNAAMRPMGNMNQQGPQFSMPNSLAAQTAMHNFANSPNNPTHPPQQATNSAGIVSAGMTSSLNPTGTAGMASSPRPGAAVVQLEAHFKIKYPQATSDQIRTLVSQEIQRQKNTAQQLNMQNSAMHAAAGHTNTQQHLNVSQNQNHGTPNQSHAQPNTPQQAMNAGANMANVTGLASGNLAGGLHVGNPQQYAQMLRAQQQRQAAQVELLKREATNAGAAGAGNNQNTPGQGQQGGQQQTAQSNSQTPSAQANQQQQAGMNRAPSQGTPGQAQGQQPLQNQQTQNLQNQAQMSASPRMAAPQLTAQMSASPRMAPPQTPQPGQVSQSPRMAPPQLTGQVGGAGQGGGQGVRMSPHLAAAQLQAQQQARMSGSPQNAQLAGQQARMSASPMMQQAQQQARMSPQQQVAQLQAQQQVQAQARMSGSPQVQAAQVQNQQAGQGQMSQQGQQGQQTNVVNQQGQPGQQGQQQAHANTQAQAQMRRSASAQS